MENNKLLNMIKEEQAENGYLSDGAIARMAQTLNLSIAHVYGVTTFYSFLSTEPLGRHVIRICKSVPCCLKNGEMMVNAIQEILGIGPGETSADGRFTLFLTNCIGACDQAPAMLVDDILYGDLSTKKIGEILQSFD